MNIRERLEADLERCRRDAGTVYDRAPLIGARYIHRRLNQLDQRFPRHGWGWKPRDAWHSGLRVIPAVWGEHQADQVIVLYRRIGGNAMFERLKLLIGELDTIGQRIERDFGRAVPHVLSKRAQGWGVKLDRLNPDPIANRQGLPAVVGDFGAVEKSRVWPMHRRGGCGYL